MYKAQIICLIIVAFIGASHFCSGGKKGKAFHWFSALIIVSLIQLSLDVITNYTVNHLESVSPMVNRLVHNLFFVLFLVIFFVTYKYLQVMTTEEIGKRVEKFRGSYLPMLVGGIGVFFLPLYYKETPKGNHSYGPPITLIYIAIAIYIIFIVKNIFRYRKELPRKKKIAIIITLCCELAISIYQAIFPEALISCFGIVLINLGIYMTVENPDAVLVELLKKETERADIANQAKTDFLANMSHEIRTPINAVLGMNEMILRESKEDSVREYAAKLQGAAKSLLSIINDILDITKIEAGKVEIMPVEYDFSSMIHDVVNMISFKAKAKGLDFQTDIDENIPGKLFGDDIRIRQILVNILNNAVKYTPEGNVTLKIELLPSEQEQIAKIKFHIKDTGIGIKEEDLEILSTPFSRIEEKRNRNIEGTGLGMSITTRLLYMLGSELKAKSQYGVGSEFSFILKQKILNDKPIGPLNQRMTKNHTEMVYQAKYEAPDAKILVVDDNEMNRFVFCGLLKESKIQIDEAKSGRECLDKIINTAYDIIFMDHMMPGMDGIETFRAMNLMENSLCKNTPVVVLTANAIVGAKEQYLKEGFEGYLSKPIDCDKLENTIKELLPEELLHYVSSKNVEDTEKESIDVPELPMIDGLDWQFALTHFKDETSLIEAVKLFAASLEYHEKELASLLENIHQETVCKEYCTKVHGMKSMAAFIGIIPLAGMAKVLEDAARNQEQEVLEQMTPIFLKVWRKYKELLREFLPQTQTEKKSAKDHRKEIEEILKNIKTAAEDMDIDKLDELSASLEEYAFETEWEKEIADIKKAIMNFDIEYLLGI